MIVSVFTFVIFLTFVGATRGSGSYVMVNCPRGVQCHIIFITKMPSVYELASTVVYPLTSTK